jgi:hypothetical protein
MDGMPPKFEKFSKGEALMNNNSIKRSNASNNGGEDERFFLQNDDEESLVNPLPNSLVNWMATMNQRRLASLKNSEEEENYW